MAAALVTALTACGGTSIVTVADPDPAAAPPTPSAPVVPVADGGSADDGGASDAGSDANAPSGEPFVGALDSIRVFRTVRTPAEIALAAAP